jgi:glycosyltransferase involved in cell wall biosynthesis
MRLLTLSHGHPMFSPGGGEHAAYALHQHFDSRLGWSSIFLAAGPKHYAMEDADIIELINKKEYLLKPSNDWLFFESKLDLSLDSQAFKFFKDAQPDVVHIHHFHRVGLDLIQAIRSWLPRAKIIFTLHEFLAICPFQGQLLRLNGEICFESTALACSKCLPLHPPSDFLIRDILFRSAFSSIDHFIAPSFQLMNRYLDWGIPRSNISVIEYVLPGSIEAVNLLDSSYGNIFGFFGNVLPSKGLDVILDAFALLLADSLFPMPRLVVFSGIPSDGDDVPFEFKNYYANLRNQIERLSSCVEVLGGYYQHQVPKLMAKVDWVVMGSRWLENSPVVIIEALACKRPLLVPNIGGMAEKVRDGLDGFHYHAESPVALANIIKRCCETVDIAKQLAFTMREPESTSDILDSHEIIFRN